MECEPYEWRKLLAKVGPDQNVISGDYVAHETKTKIDGLVSLIRKSTINDRSERAKPLAEKFVLSNMVDRKEGFSYYLSILDFS